MNLFYLVCIVVWIATLISLFRRRDIGSGKRIYWIVTVLVLNVLGVLLYFLFGPHEQAIQSPRRPKSIPTLNRFCPGKRPGTLSRDKTAFLQVRD